MRTHALQHYRPPGNTGIIRWLLFSSACGELHRHRVYLCICLCEEKRQNALIAAERQTVRAELKGKSLVSIFPLHWISRTLPVFFSLWKCWVNMCCEVCVRLVLWFCLLVLLWDVISEWTLCIYWQNCFTGPSLSSVEKPPSQYV